LAGGSENNVSLGTLRGRSENNFKADLNYVRRSLWNDSQTARDAIHWRTAVSMAMKILVPQKAGGGQELHGFSSSVVPYRWISE
jgi:hypothetical protein